MPNPTAPQPAANIGRQVNLLRKERGLSINELSIRAVVSVGMISQIERGLTNPSLKTLERLRVALSVPLSTLLAESADGPADSKVEGFARRADDAPLIFVGQHGMTKKLLSPAGNHSLQMVVITMPSGSESEDVVIGEGEKAGWVLEGKIVVILGGQAITLGQGDSFQFSGLVPHSLHNRSNTDARVLWIIDVKRTETHI